MIKHKGQNTAAVDLVHQTDAKGRVGKGGDQDEQDPDQDLGFQQT